MLLESEELGAVSEMQLTIPAHHEDEALLAQLDEARTELILGAEMLERSRDGRSDGAALQIQGQWRMKAARKEVAAVRVRKEAEEAEKGSKKKSRRKKHYSSSSSSSSEDEEEREERRERRRRKKAKR